MRTRVFTVLAVVLALTVCVVIWKSAHPKPRKYIVAKKAARPAVTPAKKKAALPPITKKYVSPKVVIVMDDFGNTKMNLSKFFSIGKPITLSVLPSERYTKEVASEALAKGYEVILHLPMEPKPGKDGKPIGLEIDTIRVGMSESEILEKLNKNLDGVPGITGVSNHMGSLATENKHVMAIVLSRIKRKGLFFFDSLTSDDSVCGQVAKSLGLRFAKRDLFLDNSSDPKLIEKEVFELRRMAFARGRAIAVCHDRKNTVAVLAKMMPAMAEEGIEFVKLSDMVN